MQKSASHLIWTRPKDDWSKDAFLFHGFENFSHLPCTKNNSINSVDFEPLLDLVKKFENIAVLITSRKCAEIFCCYEILKAHFLKTPVYCIGAPSAQFLKDAGFTKVLTLPKVYNAKSLGNWVIELQHDLMILPGPIKRAYDLSHFFAEHSCPSFKLDLYETTICNFMDDPNLVKRVNSFESQNFIVAFASPMAVEGFVAQLNHFKNSKIIALAIGQTTAQEAHQHFDSIEISPHQTLASLVQTARNLTKINPLKI